MKTKAITGLSGTIADSELATMQAPMACYRDDTPNGSRYAQQTQEGLAFVYYRKVTTIAWKDLWELVDSLNPEMIPQPKPIKEKNAAASH